MNNYIIIVETRIVNKNEEAYLWDTITNWEM